MKSRTDFVSIGWMDQLRQAMYNQIKAMGALLWVLLGFTVGLGNMMMEISPFGTALCAAAPFRYLPAAALGSAAGSLLLSNLAELGGAHTLTIKYTAAILLITLARRTAAHSESTMQRTTAAPLLAFFGLLLPSVASLLAQSFSGYKLVMALAEATMAAACAYFLARGLKAFSLGQGLFTLTRADFISVVLTASMLIVSLSNVTFGGISLGRLLAALAVLLCALAAMVILPNLYRVFYFIAENTDSLKMQLRFAEVGNLLSGAGITQGSDAGTRMKLYTASLKSFLSAPLFGIGDLVLKTVDNPREIVGGHSIVCDYLAYYGLVGSVLFHSILVTNFARIEKILDRRGRFLYLVVFVLYYVQITVNAGYNEPLIEVLFLLVPALLVLNTERCRTRTAATGDSQYIRSRAVQ